MKKVLLVLSRVPWPIDSGMKGLLSYWCEILHNTFKCEVSLFFVNQEDINPSDIPSYINSFEYAGKVRTKTKLKNLFCKTLFGYWPLQNSLYYDRNNHDKLQEYVNKVQPDIVLYDMVRAMEYYRINTSAIKIMYLGDLLSNRYAFQLKHKNYDNIFGQSNETGLFAKMAKNKLLSKLALIVEKNKVLKAEIKSAKLFDKVVFIAEKERELYAARTKSDKTYVVPIGIDYDYFSQTKNDITQNKLVFLGNLKYGPNYHSVIDICDKLLPKITSDYHMTFIGNAPDDLVNKYTSECVSFLGRVDDMRIEIGQSALFVSPISFGTGIKTKIIEAFAMGKCVVTNTIGAENIDGESGTHFFVEDDYSKMASLIDNLLQDRETIEIVGKNAKQLAKNKYTYSEVENAINTVFFGD